MIWGCCKQCGPEGLSTVPVLALVWGLNPGVLCWAVSTIYFSFYLRHSPTKLLRLAFNLQFPLLSLCSSWRHMKPARAFLIPGPVGFTVVVIMHLILLFQTGRVEGDSYRSLVCSCLSFLRWHLPPVARVQCVTPCKLSCCAELDILSFWSHWTKLNVKMSQMGRYLLSDRDWHSQDILLQWNIFRMKIINISQQGLDHITPQTLSSG